jgi:hypothetical protein
MSTTNQPIEGDRAAASPMRDIQPDEPSRPAAGTPDQSVEDAVERSLNDLAVERRSRHSVPPDAPADVAPSPRGTAADER